MRLETVFGKDFVLHRVKLDESKSEEREGMHNHVKSCHVFAIPFRKSLLGSTKPQSNTEIHKTQSYQVQSTLTVIDNCHSP